MAKAKTSKPARGRKLKVYRTPIGFHDAYIAAPTQKAALEAWGAGSNLFGRGDAEQVSDPELMAAPLERPGEVIKVLRGSRKEQVEALGKAAAERARKKKDGSRSKSGTTKRKKPSRAKLDEAEAALTRAKQRHQAAIDQLRRDEQALANRRGQAERQAHEITELEQRLSGQKQAYQQAMDAWEK